MKTCLAVSFIGLDFTSPGEAMLGLSFRVMSELTESQLDLELDVTNGTWLSLQRTNLPACDAEVVRFPEGALESQVAEDQSYVNSGTFDASCIL